ncbi:MAG: hypothetical protein ACXV2E_06600 [Halobacteriota archaeon]
MRAIEGTTGSIGVPELAQGCVGCGFLLEEGLRRSSNGQSMPTV